MATPPAPVPVSTLGPDLDILAPWTRLLAADTPPDAAAAVLRESAKLSDRVGLPFWAAAVGRLDSPHPTVRAAAVRCLSGKHTHAAFTRIVAALADPDDGVRSEAVAALAESAEAAGDPARFVHALFHTSAEVRKIAVAKCPAKAVDFMLYLAADPQARAVLEKPDSEVIPQIWEWPVLLAAVRDDVFPVSRVAGWVGKVPWPEWAGSFSPLPGRSDDEAVAVLESLANPDGFRTLADAAPTVPPADALDGFFAVFTAPPATGVRGLASQILEYEVHDSDPGPVRHVRLAAALVVALARHGEWEPHAARVVAALWPKFLECAGVPVAVRTGAAGVFADLPADATARLREEDFSDRFETQKVFDAGVGVGPDGVPDVKTWAGLSAIGADPFGAFAAKCGLARFPELVLKNLPAAAALLRTADESAHGRRWFLGHLWDSAPPAERAKLFVKLSGFVDWSDLEPLAGKLSEADADLALTAAVVARRGEGWALDDEQSGSFFDKLVDQAGRRVPVAFLTAWAALEHPLRGRPGLPEVEKAVKNCDADEVRLAAEGLDRVRELLKAVPAAPIGSRAGLCDLLAANFPGEPEHGALLAAALLECDDPLDRVDEWLRRTCAAAGIEPNVLVSRTWFAEHGWDRTLAPLCFAVPDLDPARCADGFLKQVRARWPGLADGLAASLKWTTDRFTRGFWQLAEHVLLRGESGPGPFPADLGPVLADGLADRRAAPFASVIVRQWAEHDPASAALADARTRVLARWPAVAAADPATVTLLGPWLSGGAADSLDVEHLKTTVAGGNPGAIAAALDRLLEFGADGAKLCEALVSEHATAGKFPLRATVAEFPAGGWLRWLRAAADESTATDAFRFRAGLLLHARGDRGRLGPLLELPRKPDAGWVQPADLDALLRASELPASEFWARFLDAPAAAVAWVAALGRCSPPAAAPLPAAEREPVRQFLVAHREAPLDAWNAAAAWLLAATPTDEKFAALPLTFAPLRPGSLVGVPAAFAADLVEAMLIETDNADTEKGLLARLDEATADARRAGEDRLYAATTNPQTLSDVRSRMSRFVGRTTRLGQLADVFAWGVTASQRLLGRAFGVRPTDGKDLGYTRLNEDVVFVSPAPVLRGQSHGREVVEGLILHELGHHIYHRGPEAQKAWAAAAEDKLQPLLNIVTDEHLERNLRAKSAEYGDRLKTLGAFAFNHQQNEIPVSVLLPSLGKHAAAVLAAVPLGVARKPGCVRVTRGALLRELDRTGSSFARFFRALRLGLGNRAGDPQVAAGLALFQGLPFRKSDMPALLGITRKLREIFGQEVELLASHLVPGPGEFLAVDGEIPGDGDLTELEADHVRRQVDIRVHRIKGRPPGPRNRSGNPHARDFYLNVSDDAKFDRIEKIQPVTPDPAAAKAAAARVARPAHVLREYLKRLAGVRMHPERFRARGHRLDRGRLKALVLARDPRFLQARTPKPAADIFLGVLVDCSGSMSGDRIEKARLFGSLLAEAVRGLPWVDLRIFGFTDQVIYDAGDARRSAVEGLRAGGGNNDAAALWHAAQEALASPRRTKLLIMISDGLPTECSVAALRALVTRLTTRHRVACAQVAVHPISEVCFPHYIELNHADLIASVRAFGDTVVRLVRKTLGKR